MRTQNEVRAERGYRTVLASHPDFSGRANEFESAATDVIADILHALFDGDHYGCDSPQDVLDRALRCFEGDAEDEEES